VATVWRALTDHAHGMGYRRIAQRLRLPETTVRDWLRDFRRAAASLCDIQGGP
jgi:transposase